MEQELSTLRPFLDADGRLTALPAKERKKRMALWYLAGRLEDGRLYSEPEINALLADFLAQGQREGLVRPDVFPALDAQLLTTALEAQFSLWDARKDYLISVFSLDEKAFLARVREQLLRGLLLASKGDAR